MQDQRSINPIRLKQIYKLLLCLMVASLMACNTNSRKEKAIDTFKGSYQDNVKGIVSLRTFDHYTRRLNDGYGFYVAPNLVVTNLSFIKGAYKVKASPMDLEDFSSVQGYVAYDVDLDLVLLKVTRRNLNYLSLKDATFKADSVYQLYRNNRKLYFNEDALGTGIVSDTITYKPYDGDFKPGNPVFAQSHRLAGLVQETDGSKRVLEAKWINQLIEQKSSSPESIYELRNKSNKVYISHTKVKGFRIITNMGNIELALSDQTPDYRDNFIKLVSDHFYDSLLVHRVIKDFLVQTGAADSKYAKKDDVVGWQGPGYTLKMNIVPELFHKRGMIAASKLPEDRNRHNRSDGSQFYIVAGRRFSDAELDDLEAEKGIKYTTAQRKAYTSVGGAPYLDGDYTVFGWVTKGMDVVDKMAGVKTYAIDRPVNEIRIKTIEIIRK
ncbi:peptidylprolyl isomerase [Carboxylicivirga mesophila]|uniref:peptidylprolyl isomerase n=1 Tax=Carboxylicivirga mesophila TaxID=1166478 RepID=A0ABS5KDE2_9BACT|nr:peptidylprolyl isomerase [Carboxylicivirga mesophila]MBS2213010.1 peptidylprolyl isomerase [Carboxylicivirga mesophila]